jgi:hypothetical protein
VNTFKNESFLNLSNTSFSNINKGKAVFWFNINPSKFEKDHNILCVDKKEIILIHIPKLILESLTDKFKRRSDNGLIDIEIPIKGETDYLKDIKSGVNLRSYATFFRLIDISKNDTTQNIISNTKATSNNYSKEVHPVLSFLLSIGSFALILIVFGGAILSVIAFFKALF